MKSLSYIILRASQNSINKNSQGFIDPMDQQTDHTCSVVSQFF